MATTVNVDRNVILMSIGQPPEPSEVDAKILLLEITELPSRKFAVGLLKILLIEAFVQVTD